MPPKEFTTIEDIQAHPKELTDYSEGEKGLINNNWDKLGEEEQAAFTPFRPVIEEPEIVAQTPEMVAETPVTPEPAVVAPAPTATSPTAPTVFNAEQIEALVKSVVEQTRPKEEPKPAPPVTQAAKPFEDGYIPADPNEFAEKLASNPVFAEMMRKALSPKVQEDIQLKQTLSQKQEADKMAEYQKQYQVLIDGKKVPSLLNADGTQNEEGIKINDAIAKIGNQYGLQTYEKSYDLWSKLPVEAGGGFDTKGATIAVQKAKLSAQKQAAAKVGKGVGDGVAKGEEAKNAYTSLHTQTMDQLLAARTAK